MSNISIFPPIYRSILSYLRLYYHVSLKIIINESIYELHLSWTYIHILSIYSAFLYAYLSFFIIFLLFLHICPSVHLSIYLSIYLSMYLSTVCTCLLVYRSINPTLNANVTVRTCTSICPSIYLRIISAWGTSVCVLSCLPILDTISTIQHNLTK